MDVRGDLDLSIDANTAAVGVGVGEETQVVPGLQYPGCTLGRGIPGGPPVLGMWTPEVEPAELRAGACGDEVARSDNRSGVAQTPPPVAREAGPRQRLKWRPPPPPAKVEPPHTCKSFDPGNEKTVALVRWEPEPLSGIVLRQGEPGGGFRPDKRKASRLSRTKVGACIMSTLKRGCSFYSKPGLGCPPEYNSFAGGPGVAPSPWRNSGPRLVRAPGQPSLKWYNTMAETSEKNTPPPDASNLPVLSTPVDAARSTWDLPIAKAMSLATGAAPLLDQVAYPFRLSCVREMEAVGSGEVKLTPVYEHITAAHNCQDF
ncbi:hypothetical protein HPB50_019205 [Hyalomma asiaticum]|uniref:Uncharacterized protein n=1 Tax=Hyalomma asiaticum TaxID=266040 RepID=A0ACB7T5W7_HYAAI|nr:hypothetical protein HPB50_019205 [Hyalomma asiaticum]